MEVVKPAANNSGAVSPMILAIAMITPVAMPARAVGMTTFTMVSHFGTPSAYEASRSSFGTILSISSVALTTTGVISTAREIAPAKPLIALAGPRMIRKREKAKSPATIDGMPVITSTKKVTGIPSIVAGLFAFSLFLIILGPA